MECNESAHWFRTLRAEPGDVCCPVDGAGRIAEAEVRAGKRLTVRSLETAASPEPPLLHLYIAPPRHQKMDHILRQATELGV